MQPTATETAARRQATITAGQRVRQIEPDFGGSSVWPRRFYDRRTWANHALGPPVENMFLNSAVI